MAMFCATLSVVAFWLLGAGGDCKTSASHRPSAVTNGSMTTDDKRLHGGVLEASSAILADSLKVLPTLANGHLGFTVFEDAVYMAGLYNGAGGLSHRARIPNVANLRLDNACYRGTDPSCWLALDLDRGLFQVNYTAANGSHRVTHLLYPHALYRRLIVNQFLVERLTPDAGDITVRLWSGTAFTSEDIHFQPIRMSAHSSSTPAIYQTCGRTVEIENGTYQPETSAVCVLWNYVPDRLVLRADEQTASFKFIMSVDANGTIARSELSKALLATDDELLRSHTTLWGSFWGRFQILTTGNGPLQRAVRASVFFLVSSLPFEASYAQSGGPFFGLSPTGLGRGGSNLDDYEGHSFWDTEIWMLPVLNLIDPWYGRLLIEYRVRMLPVAKDLAVESGHNGVRFPWESGFTGTEVTQPCCPEVAIFQHHISGDISFGLRHHLATTQDLGWLQTSGGCLMAQEIAKFWASRLIFNHTGTDQYDIVAVMGPDEDHENVTNNAYTNVIAGYALYFGEFAGCICGEDVSLRNWSDIAARIKLPYDVARDYHPQFDDYRPGTVIKQADTVLLGFPLLYGGMNASTRRNDLRTYEPVTRDTGPAMTWAMHAINHLDIGDPGPAADNFVRSYQPYIRGPFHVWHELTQAGGGARNFITGAGGFLQAVVFGYAGVRVYLDRLEVRAIAESLPTAGFNVTVRGIQYLGALITVTQAISESEVSVTHMETMLTIGFGDGNDIVDVVVNQPYRLNNRTAIIRAKFNPYEECDLPADLIGG
ncbi:protein-glucosylgalactosylhydroxylysine glucosidase-like [Anopheles nili]|uniref:protein-glucosylgalactosylhydroxylysine glucosidase-like n=1 Tax=Anopheles nili TaxID=185578 RepID=UPI00237B8371|nr:protein-glucosylgalactosylhydroxylysine glucosidase-like [Anopheles nili]